MNLADRAVFAPSVEGLVRGVGMRLKPEHRAELRALGIDLDRQLLPGYPAELWHRALAVVARSVYPELGPEEAHYRLGERTVHGLEETLLGKAMLKMARVVGPRRTLLRLPSSARTGSNFAALTVEERAPNDFELVSCPYMGFAEFMQGSVHAALEISGAVSPSVEIASYDRAAERLTLRARWR